MQVEILDIRRAWIAGTFSVSTPSAALPRKVRPLFHDGAATASKLALPNSAFFQPNGSGLYPAKSPVACDFGSSKYQHTITITLSPSKSHRSTVRWTSGMFRCTKPSSVSMLGRKPSGKLNMKLRDDIARKFAVKLCSRVAIISLASLLGSKN